MNKNIVLDQMEQKEDVLEVLARKGVFYDKKVDTLERVTIGTGSERVVQLRIRSREAAMFEWEALND